MCFHSVLGQTAWGLPPEVSTAAQTGQIHHWFWRDDPSLNVTVPHTAPRLPHAFIPVTVSVTARQSLLVTAAGGSDWFRVIFDRIRVLMTARPAVTAPRMILSALNADVFEI